MRRCGRSPRCESALTLRDRIHSFLPSQLLGLICPHSTQEVAAMAVGKVSDASFESDVLKSAEPVVVDFWAEWCGPCRMIGPALEEIAGQLGDKVKIVKLNVDENPKTAGQYGIMSIPTLMLFKNGKEAARQVGAVPKHKLHQWISAAV